MKKFIFSALAAIGLLLSPSCSDENEALSGSGNEALVSFNVNLADGVSTKATIGDGETAKKLHVKVFDEGGTLISGLSEDTYDISSKSATVNLSLVKGKTYKFLFWAQSGETDAFSFEGNTVKVSYTSAAANDEKRDAFYAAKTRTVSGSFQEDVRLHRPFAQLNFLTTEEDILAATNAGLNVNRTSITISSAAKILRPSFDPATKPSVSDEIEGVQFGFADVPFIVSPSSYLWIKDGEVKETAEEGAIKYFYLATTYFLVNNSEDATAQSVLANVNMKVEGAEGDGLNVQSVPVRMNYRTNIYGNLLTSTGQFHVTINENFNTSQQPGQDIEVSERTVNSEAQVVEAFEEGASKVTLTTELTSSASSVGIIPQTYADQNTDVIELVLEQSVSSDYVFKYKDANQEQTDHFAPATVHITIPEGSATISESQIQLARSTVYVNGVKVTTMTAETSSNTLVVGAGTEIETLKVKAGNVRIMKGGKVKNITNNTGGQIYVDIEDGGILGTNPTDETIEVRQSISTAEGLVAFAEAVNGGNTYAGRTVVLNADIDLNNVHWTPIGGNTMSSYPSKTFAGTFDGQEHTISNLTTSSNQPDYATAGLFGTVKNATIKNVKLSNVNVSSTHFAGAIVAYHAEGTLTIENCHVDGGTITSTPESTTSGYDNGNQAGGIVGNIQGTITNCSVSNLTIKAYRDLGGIAGCAAGTVTNNTVNGLTLIIDATNDYKGNDYKANANPVVGRKEDGFSDGGGNTATNVVYQVASETALTQAMTYAQDATVQLTAGTYSNIINVKGKRLTIEPIQGANVVIAGVDGQQNGEHTGIIICNNITFDNSKQAAGWYTGTGPRINPCVGAWGGDFTFNNCTFLVEGTTGKETGVMTWWITEETNMRFYGCTFNGIEDNIEARAMQIYDNVNLTVENCIFTTKKRYALKYVGKDGNTAILKNNSVSNCEFMVELGSSTYPGSNYTVTFENNTLADGVYEYKVANEESATIHGGTPVPTNE